METISKEEREIRIQKVKMCIRETKYMLNMYEKMLNELKQMEETK